MRQGQHRQRREVHRRGARDGHRRRCAPDVNESRQDFTVVDAEREGARRRSKVIRFGLGAVKGVGESAVEAILEARASRAARSTSLFDFCRRVDGRKVNRKVLEELVKAGAFDGSPRRTASRARSCSARIDVAIERAAEAQRERESGQTTCWRCSAAAAQRRSHGRRRRPLGEDKYPDGRGVDAQGAARVREGGARLLHQRPPARSLRGDIRRFTTATARQLHREGRARRGHPRRASSPSTRSGP